jgi:hypothetical protein
VVRTVTVNKRSQAISFTQPVVQTFAPNGTFTLVGSAPGGAVTFTSSNTNVVAIVGSTATKIGAGTAVITANQSGGANYSPATAVTRTVTVNKGAQSISLNPPLKPLFSTGPLRWQGQLLVETLPLQVAIRTFFRSPE